MGSGEDYKGFVAPKWVLTLARITYGSSSRILVYYEIGSLEGNEVTRTQR
jgi:hypothetical protein